MFELIYRICRMNGPDDIIILCRTKTIDEIIDNIVTKYNVPLQEEIMKNSYKDGFWIRELPEMPLNDNAFNHYLEYYKNTEWKRK